jgi:WD40-like Beta Propeller Repeat
VVHRTVPAQTTDTHRPCAPTSSGRNPPNPCASRDTPPRRLRPPFTPTGSECAETAAGDVSPVAWSSQLCSARGVDGVVVPSLVGRALPRVVALAVVAGSFGCVWAVSASAAFPGRDGLLVVQPLHGPGLVLVRSNGTGGRRICLNTAVCGLPVNPVWSADGRELAYRDGPKVLAGGGIDSGEVFVIYPDGSCLECPSAPLNRPVAPIAATDGPSFLADGELGLVRGRAAGLPPDTIIGVGIDGLRYRKLAGPASSPVWSSQGRLAEVRQIKHKDQVFVVDKVGARPRQLTHDGASSPSWSPRGAFLAVVHAGSIEVIDLRGRVVRRLARGHAPAWSPDGREIAFVATHNRIAVISGRGDRRDSLAPCAGDTSIGSRYPRVRPAGASHRPARGA